MISFTPCACTMRRALLRSSRMEMAEVSSTKMGVRVISPSAWVRRGQSLGLSLPVRMLWLSNPLSIEMRRVTSCSAFISRLKNPTGTWS